MNPDLGLENGLKPGVEFQLPVVSKATVSMTPSDVTEKKILQVTAGDSLEKIARIHLRDPKRWREIVTLNNIAAPCVIKVGSEIFLPSAPSQDPEAQSQVTLTQSMTVFGFAKLYCNDVKKAALILQCNMHIQDPLCLPVGITISLPKSDTVLDSTNQEAERLQSRSIPLIRIQGDTPTMMFIESYRALANMIERETGIDQRFVLAQIALETGWGNHAPGNNLFGIKDGKTSTDGKQVVRTHEITHDGQKIIVEAAFESYLSPRDSCEHYMRFLNSHERYKCFFLSGNNLIELTKQPYLSGYCTDPEYSAKLTSIIKKFELE